MKQSKSKILTFTLLVLSIVFFACEKEVEFDNDLIKAEIVINGFVFQDSIISVKIATSRSIPGVQQNFKWLDDANVKLFIDGVEKEKLTAKQIEYEEPEYDYGYEDLNRPTVEYISTSIAQKGKKYRLEVSHPDYTTAVAETTLPEPVEIIKVDTSIVTEKQYDYFSNTLEYKVHFKDSAEHRDYYRLAVNGMIGTWYPDNWENPEDTNGIVTLERIYYFASQDPLLNSEEDPNDFLFGGPGNRYLIFSDEFIDGKKYALELSNSLYSWGPYETRSFHEDKGEFIMIDIQLYTLSREAYLYLQSVAAHQYFDGDLFSEPVQVYSNVENGVGIFAGMSSSTYKIQIGQYPKDGVNYRDYY